MKSLIIAIAILFTIACGAKTQIPQPPIPQISKVEYIKDTIHFGILPNGMILLIGKVNGKPANFILDTGASSSVFDDNQGKDYGYVCLPDGGTATSISGEMESKKVINKVDVELGKSQLWAYPSCADLSIFTESMNRMSGTKMIGLVGADFLVRFKAVIDYEQKYVIITVLKIQN